MTPRAGFKAQVPAEYTRTSGDPMRRPSLHPFPLAAALTVLLVATAPVRADDAAPARPPLRLDLHAPPINHVLSMHQIETFTSDSDDQGTDYVTVRPPGTTPPCCGTIIAVPWAVLHPSEAWRIFTPFIGACGGTWCTER
jgi:hypothetical protein